MKAISVISVLAAVCMVAVAFSGCTGGKTGTGGTGGTGGTSGTGGGDGKTVALGKVSGGNWTNGSVSGVMSETITEEDRSDPSKRQKTIPTFEFKLEGAKDVSWDFGDGQNGTGANVTHQYSAPGSYLVNATSGGKWSTILALVNYHASGEGMIDAVYPGQDVEGQVYQEGRNYFDYTFYVAAGGKIEIDLKGKGTVGGVPGVAETDIDLRLRDPTGKEIAASTGEGPDEHIVVKKAKATGN